MRWFMLIILFVVRISMGYQFQSVASLSPQLVRDFGFTYTEVGSLIGFYLLPGIFFAIPSGLMTRATTDKKLLVLGSLVMIFGAIIMGFSARHTGLYIGRLTTGIGGTIFSLILTKMVTEWFYKKEIITALAIMLAAWPFGIALGLLSQEAIGNAYGIAMTFHLTAAGVAVGLILVILFYRDAPREAGAANSPLRFRIPLRQFVHSSLLAIAWTLFNAILVIIVSFSPDALISVGYSHNTAHTVTSLMMWATMVSVPFGGRALERFGHVTLSIAISLAVTTGAIIAISRGITPEVSFVILGIAFGIPAGAIMSMTAETMTAEYRGPALGIFYTWYYIGMTFAPALGGWTRDVSGRVEAPLLLAAVMAFTVAVAIGLLRRLQAVWSIDTSA